MLTDDFLLSFKRRTEDYWRRLAINPAFYGYQFQQGTCWNHGLSESEIKEYEALLSIGFPDDLKTFFKVMNGTNLPTLNVYGSSGEPPRHSVGAYAYPRDLEIIKRRINDAETDREQLTVTMAEQGLVLAPEDRLVPIYDIRFAVCTPDPASCVVLSFADGWDAIVYGSTLQEYLGREFLKTIETHHR